MDKFSTCASLEGFTDFKVAFIVVWNCCYSEEMCYECPL
jgi:hypothetical protein